VDEPPGLRGLPLLPGLPGLPVSLSTSGLVAVGLAFLGGKGAREARRGRRAPVPSTSANIHCLPAAAAAAATSHLQGQGSGFVWDTNGHIVTNYHVIRGASEVQVSLIDQSTWPAKIVAGGWMGAARVCLLVCGRWCDLACLPACLPACPPACQCRNHLPTSRSAITHTANPHLLLSLLAAAVLQATPPRILLCCSWRPPQRCWRN
jgi:hypothetical protein